MAVFEGSGVAIVTPFTADGAVNFNKLGELIDFNIKNGTDAIIICGTTGEGSTLSMDEHKECIRFAVEHTAHRVPVVAGTGSNCTETAIELSQDAEKFGADALLVVTPYYNKATQKGLVEHYSMIARSVSLPIIMYNVPSRTGTNIQPATAVEIARRNENVVAVKDAVGNLSQTAMMAHLADGCLDIYSGNDDEVLPILSLGGKGVISVLANVMPKETHDMVMDYLSGEPARMEKARKFQLDAIPLIKALFCEVNPIPVKHALNLMGMEVGGLRHPLCEMEPQDLELLKKAMQNMHLI